ncbi:hypothetical protein HJP15_19115 [Pseudoalteromonas sp. NEC-BIFX-2020_002]|uniref:hypothetical protein n=1 Tax=Pseudoalteromonas sp. NEC-BIFX-2020_002 TaxID=2732353 RepID=UPI0014772CEF|nr:hypothetical protein [Pseudoalteromonas sp. NEC-BIFX-2020_002]NNG45003.1 hypothetical protein [Pseudoalteromonas sp. NEC-BIFX-2020_002]
MSAPKRLNTFGELKQLVKLAEELGLPNNAQLTICGLDGISVRARKESPAVMAFDEYDYIEQGE